MICIFHIFRFNFFFILLVCQHFNAFPSVFISFQFFFLQQILHISSQLVCFRWIEMCKLFSVWDLTAQSKCNRIYFNLSELFRNTVSFVIDKYALNCMTKTKFQWTEVVCSASLVTLPYIASVVEFRMQHKNCM